jgi:2-polyprenyl-3-methyl-5-hydroxy-6-metoxy-1,4-benzoquinol methylase
MFIVKDYLNIKNNFNWSEYFSEQRRLDFLSQVDIEEIYRNVRVYLKEDNSKMGFVIFHMLKELFKSEKVISPRVLELGAASGFLTRSILSIYQGTGVLVDKNEESCKQFYKLDDPVKFNIQYIVSDLFELDIKQKFDIVCSFGLIEHFPDKSGVMSIHKKFIVENGKLLIIVPLDTPLTRAYFEVNPELNLGYRELLTKNEFIKILKESDLKILNTAISFGYSYDFIAVLCAL